MFIGGGFIVLRVRSIGCGTGCAIIGRAAAGPLLLALVVYAADFVLRAIRYWVMLQAATDRPLAMRPCIGPFIASFGISDILPLRAGDGFRVVWFHRQFGIPVGVLIGTMLRSEEHTSELQSLMRLSYAVFCLKKNINKMHNAND